MTPTLVPFDQWQESNAGNRADWAREMLESLAQDYRELRLEDRIHIRHVLREAAICSESDGDLQ